MEGILSILGFSLGASLGMGVVRAVGGGPRPVLREVMKAGMAVTDIAKAAGSRVSDTMSSAATDARESLDGVRTEATQEKSGRRSRARADSEPRKIVIAKE